MDKLSKNRDIDTKIIEGWQKISEPYQFRYQIPTDDIHFGPMIPGNNELKIISKVCGKNILEIGCGGGQNTIFCAREGARRSVGIDPSSKQLKYAQKSAKLHDIEVDFYPLKATELDRLNECFDLVLSVYALMYVENIKIVLEKVYAMLADNGEVVISVDHPFRLSGEWIDPTRFVVESYFATGWQSWNYDFPESRVETTMYRFHRTIADWVNAFLEVGLKLKGLYEPLPVSKADDRFGIISKHGERSQKNIFTRDKLLRIPSTLIIHGVKL